MSFWDDINPVNVAKKVYNDVVKPIWTTGKNAVEDLGAWVDKTVADVIPGGWTTVVEAGLAFTPAGPLASAGFGAASGGTGGFKRNKFDMSGAIMGGISGYGVGSLATSVASAGAPPATAPSGQATMTYGSTPTWSAETGYTYEPIANAGTPLPNPATSAEFVGPMAEGTPMPGTQNLSTISGSQVGAPPPPSGLENLGNTMATNASNAGQGIQNLVGLGPNGLAGIGPAASAVNAGMSYTAYSGLGTTILMDKMAKLEKEHGNGNVSDPEYEKQKAELQASIAASEEAVNKYTYGADPDASEITPQETLYATAGENETLYPRKPQQTLYADGGSVGNMAVGGPTMDAGFSFNSGDQTPMYGLGGAIQKYAFGGFLENTVPKGLFADLENKIKEQEAKDAKVATDKAAADKAALDKVFSDNPYKDEAPMPSAPPQSSNIPSYEPTQDLGLTLYKQKKLGGIPTYGIGGYAQGGPRFLSGGGDGMSDSIKASIDGHQEARLADGEFVIPADIVSHLGNGSSKAGAKQLYAMMERIRKARTGNPKQGKQINPQKLMPA